MVDCRNCKLRFRADDLKGPPSDIACPNCGQRGTLTEARQFNLMFKTHVGPMEESASVAYLRPETAQGIFVNFDNVATTIRRKLPFGIAQIGKSFRNEITPGNFIFRDREFEQMEMEFFVHPSEEDQWFAYWVEERLRWWTDEMGIAADRLRLRPHDPDELSHYSRQTTDVEYAFPMGWSELEGVADRFDYDLRAHAAGSGKSLAIFDEASGEHVTPFVIEPAMGVDRAVLTVLLDAYTEEQLEKEKRTVLRIRPSLAPIKVAVLPLLRNRPELVERARALGRRPQGPPAGGVRRHRLDREAVPAPGRDRHAVLRDGGRGHAGRRRRHHPRARLDDPGARGAGRHSRSPGGADRRYHRLGGRAAPDRLHRWRTRQRLASPIRAWPGCWPPTTRPSRRTAPTRWPSCSPRTRGCSGRRRRTSWGATRFAAPSPAFVDQFHTVSWEPSYQLAAVHGDQAFLLGRFVERRQVRRTGEVERVPGRLVLVCRREADGAWRITHAMTSRYGETTVEAGA